MVLAIAPTRYPLGGTDLTALRINYPPTAVGRISREGYCDHDVKGRVSALFGAVGFGFARRARGRTDLIQVQWDTSNPDAKILDE